MLPILREYAIDGIIQKKENVFDKTIRDYLYEGKPISEEKSNPNSKEYDVINGIISYGKQTID